MAFTVEDETGLTNANAYITIAEFEAYWDDRGYDSSSVSDANKQVAIIKATDYIENRFRMQFKGSREFEGQALSFPRVNLYDFDGVLISGLPNRLKYAVAEYAKRALSAELAPDPTIDDSGFNIVNSRKKVGPLEKEIQFADGGTPQIFRPYPSADRLLSEYLSSSGSRLVRA